MDRTLWLETRAIARRHERRGASDAAEDLAQDLAVAALEGGAAVSRPGAWLERVGRNAVIDRWRTERRRQELAPRAEPAAPAASVDPEAALLGREQRSVVRRAVGGLPRPQRRAALLRFHCDLPFEEVAARLGTRPATARTRVHRALAALRDKVSGLRALFFWPGAPAAALGLTIVAANVETSAPPRATTTVAIAGDAASTSARVRRFAPVRLMAAEATPAPTARRSDHQGASPSPQAAPTPPVQRFDFDNDQVIGDLQNPDGIPVFGTRPAPEPSLIELRRHFVPEMLKSLEDL
jgi:RNA polymerase sigma factor (sigma-70 family)